MPKDFCLIYGGKMDERKLIDAINHLNIWKQGDQRAPHKPLLILYALAKLQNSDQQWLNYNVAGEDLRKLLIDFGPLRKSQYPEQPFVRLTSDHIWQLSIPSESIDRNNIKDKWLKNNQVAGGFSDEVYRLLKNDPNLIIKIAQMVLDTHFPESIHDEILNAVGLDLSYTYKKVKKRAPEFREKILIAYGYSCAVCGFNVRLGHKLIGIEAAHIKWHQAGGPDIETNGIALCAMHHKLFDLGAFTITTEHKLLTSQHAHGSHGLEEWLLRYDQNVIAKPREGIYLPQGQYLEWHVREVFKG